MDVEELKACILALRERRESIPALRDYRPQRSKSSKSSKSSMPEKEVSLDGIFGGLFAKGEASEAITPEPETKE